MSCGIIAARACATMHLARLQGREPLDENVRDAVHLANIIDANRRLTCLSVPTTNVPMTNTRYLLGEEVHFLFNGWLRRPTEPTSLCMFRAQPASPGSSEDCCLSPVDLPTHGIGVSLDLAADDGPSSSCTCCASSSRRRATTNSPRRSSTRRSRRATATTGSPWRSQCAVAVCDHPSQQ